MKKTLLPTGREISWELTRKPVKNVNIRVRADGSVRVSAPRWVSDRQVEEILQSRAAFLEKALNKFAALEKKVPENPVYGQGETVYLLGRPYQIALRSGGKNQVSLEGETLCLTVTDPASEALRKKTMEAYYKDLCLQVTADLCRRIQPRLAHLGVPVPAVQVRSMTSRWGSCKPSQGKVTFARQLAEAPVECVEYVVWHELVHFLHPNHSPDFYACLEGFLPDWRIRRKTLNSYSYREMP